MQRRTVSPSRSYQSQVELPVTFGLGTADRVEAIDVTWPDGTTSREPVGAVDRLIVIEQAAGRRALDNARRSADGARFRAGGRSARNCESSSRRFVRSSSNPAASSSSTTTVGRDAVTAAVLGNALDRSEQREEPARLEVDDDEPTAGRERSVETLIDGLRIGQMVVDATQIDAVAARRRQSGVGRAALDQPRRCASAPAPRPRGCGATARRRSRWRRRARRRRRGAPARARIRPCRRRRRRS